MLFLKAAFCRVFQTAFRLVLPGLPYREPEIVSSCAKLDTVFKKESIHSVLIVTDKGIRDHGLVHPVEQVLQTNGIAYFIYDGTQPNPTVLNVEEALKMYHSCQCDALIAIGGGSAMDCAKAVGARVVYPKRSLNQLGGILKVLRRLPTLIAIPTTAGTGSEVTLAAVITDPASHHKYALMSFPLIPRYAVLDATLTYSLPPHLTATTGMDALTHAVEAYIGRSTTKETRRLALEATKLVFENIETAYHEGKNHEAKENMLHAAYKAGVCSESDSHEAGAKKFITAIKELNAKMGIPIQLPDIKAEDIPQMAKYAEKEANPLYPVPMLMTQKELEQFYYQIADWSK